MPSFALLPTSLFQFAAFESVLAKVIALRVSPHIIERQVG